MSSPRLAEAQWTVRGMRGRRQLTLLACVALVFALCFVLGRLTNTGGQRPVPDALLRIGPLHAYIPSSLTSVAPLPSRLALTTTGLSPRQAAGSKKVTKTTASAHGQARSRGAVAEPGAGTGEASQPSETAAAAPAIESSPPTSPTPAAPPTPTPAAGSTPTPATPPARSTPAAPSAPSVSRSAPTQPSNAGPGGAGSGHSFDNSE